MAGVKGKSGGHGLGGNKKKAINGVIIEREKFQIIAYKETIAAIKELKAKCSDKSNKLDFVHELNTVILNGLKG